jgi:hypothetical protein
VAPGWSGYQEEVAGFFRSLGLSATTNATIEGVRTSHDVDVVVRSKHAGFAGRTGTRRRVRQRGHDVSEPGLPAAVLVRRAESLHHSVHGDHRDGRSFMIALPFSLGRRSWAPSHPCYELLCPDPTPLPGFLSRTFLYAGWNRSDRATVQRDCAPLPYVRAECGRALGPDRSRRP